MAVIGSTVRVTLGGLVALGLPPQPTTAKATSTTAKSNPTLRRNRWPSPARLARSALIVCLPPLTGPSLDTARAKDACCSGFAPPKSPSRQDHFPLRAPETPTHSNHRLGEQDHTFDHVGSLAPKGPQSGRRVSNPRHSAWEA